MTPLITTHEPPSRIAFEMFTSLLLESTVSEKRNCHGDCRNHAILMVDARDSSCDAHNYQPQAMWQDLGWSTGTQ